MLAGQATGFYTRQGCWNSANGHTLGNGIAFTLPPTDAGITLVSHVNRANHGSASASTNTCTKTFTIRWVPDAGKDLVTDPAPPTIGVTVNIGYTATYDGVVEQDGGTISASVCLSADGVVYLNQSGSQSTPLGELSWTSGDCNVASPHAFVPVAPSGVATLVVELTAATSASFAPNNGSRIRTPVEARVTITPTPVPIWAILAVPDRATNWYPKAQHNRLLFDVLPTARLYEVDDPTNPNPPPVWRARFFGTPAGNYLNDTTFTSFEVGAPCVRTPGTKAVSGDTIIQPFTYLGLPLSNSDLGEKIVTMAVCAADLATTQSATVAVFYTKVGNNHPGDGSGVTPNWYYYWSQTAANYGTHRWGGTNGNNTGMTYWNAAEGAWVSEIYELAGFAGAAGTWNNAEGIDLFANTCRHEQQHLDDLVFFWGDNPVDMLYDLDGDHIPDDIEELLVAGHPYDPLLRATYQDTFSYGVNPLPDIEDYALRREPAWVNGSCDSSDWASPGHQWQ